MNVIRQVVSCQRDGSPDNVLRLVVTRTVPADNLEVGTRPDSSRVPAVFRRRPMCRRVLHFTMKLINNNLNEDFELVGAQIYYNLQGRLR